MAGANYDIASNVLITVKANNDWTPSWTIKNSDGTLLDISLYLFGFIVRDGTGKIILQKLNADITKSGTPQSTIGFTVARANMNFLPGLYRYQLDATYPDGTTRTWFEKPLLVNENIGQYSNIIQHFNIITADTGAAIVTSDTGANLQSSQ